MTNEFNSPQSEDIKNKSIEEYLHKRGFLIEKRGRLKYCKSPLSDEKTASFCIYPTNTFYDWSNGYGGDIIKLVELMEGLNFQEALSYLDEGEYKEVDVSNIDPVEKEEFIVDKYLTEDENEKIAIRKYAFNRGIVNDFSYSKFFVYDKDNFIKRIAMGFIHVDEQLNVCGIKMRDIDPYKNIRFSARGTQKYYIVKNYKSESSSIPLYVVESESSANSLIEFFRVIKYKAVAISFGSWNNIQERLPDNYNDFRNKRLIIDYDGNKGNTTYEEKVSKFSHLGLKEIRIELPKGEDINSLFLKGQLYKYKQFLT